MPTRKASLVGLIWGFFFIVCFWHYRNIEVTAIHSAVRNVQRVGGPAMWLRSWAAVLDKMIAFFVVRDRRRRLLERRYQLQRFTRLLHPRDGNQIAVPVKRAM